MNETTTTTTEADGIRAERKDRAAALQDAIVTLAVCCGWREGVDTALFSMKAISGETVTIHPAYLSGAWCHSIQITNVYGESKDSHVVHGATPDSVKVRAERYLAEFIASN